MTATEKQAAETLNKALSHPDESWGFFQMLSAKDRKEMDELLVTEGHPLAYEAGNQWHRFSTLYRQGFRFTID